MPKRNLKVQSKLGNEVLMMFTNFSKYSIFGKELWDNVFSCRIDGY